MASRMPFEQRCWRRDRLVLTRRAGDSRTRRRQRCNTRQTSNSEEQQRKLTPDKISARHDDLLRLHEIPRELPLRLTPYVLRLRAGLFAPVKWRNLACSGGPSADAFRGPPDLRPWLAATGAAVLFERETTGRRRPPRAASLPETVLLKSKRPVSGNNPLLRLIPRG